MSDLGTRFRKLCRELGSEERGVALWDIIESLYQVPAREYHSLAHIEHCLRVMDEMRTPVEDRGALELAIWLHDCVYDPRRKDNEERSAAVAGVFCAAMDFGPEKTRRVRGLIMATKHSGEALDGDLSAIVDIDLSSLGSEWSRFLSNTHAIRREYAWVPITDFGRGQAAFLGGLAGWPSIYRNAWFKERFEAQARANIAELLGVIARGEFR